MKVMKVCILSSNLRIVLSSSVFGKAKGNVTRYSKLVKTFTMYFFQN